MIDVLRQIINSNSIRLKVLINIFIILSIGGLRSQNLIKNGSFEYLSTSDVQCKIYADNEINEFLIHWKTTELSPDVIKNETCQYHTVRPRSGNYCVGLLNWCYEEAIGSYRMTSESMKSQLDTTLQVDSFYKLEFWIATMPTTFSSQISQATGKSTIVVNSNNFSLCFGREYRGLQDSLLLCYTIDNIPSSGEWQKYTYEFQPNARYDWVWMGNQSPYETRTMQPGRPGNYQISYYYVDDLELKKINRQEKQSRPLTLTSTKITLDNFAINSHELSQEHKAQIDSIFSKISSQQLDVQIHGYAGSKGAEKDNMNLSRKRGEAIKSYLMTKFGVSATDIRLIAHGENQSNEKENGQVRKVELVILTP